MTEQTPSAEAERVGHRNPPASKRFKKGKSGNPKGRPRNRRHEIPHDHLLGQMVTIREEGRERSVTAAEAFLLQLTKRGLEGDSAAARASLEAIELARSKRVNPKADITTIVCKSVTPGAVGSALDALQMAVKLNRYSETSRYQLKPWIVQMALDRLNSRERLSWDEQSVVLAVTRNPEKVVWPDGSTTKPKIVTCRSDDESGRC